MFDELDLREKIECLHFMLPVFNLHDRTQNKIPQPRYSDNS